MIAAQLEMQRPTIWDPLELQCRDCGAVFTGNRSRRAADIILSGFHFHTCEGRDGKRRCPDCRSRGLPERRETSVIPSSLRGRELGALHDRLLAPEEGVTMSTLRDVVLAELAGGTHTEGFADGARWAVQEANKLKPVATPSVTWRELKDALRPLKAFAGQDEVALGAAADTVLELLKKKAVL